MTPFVGPCLLLFFSSGRHRLEKALNEGKDSAQIENLHKLKVRIELICDYKHLHVIDDFIKSCRKMDDKIN
jgi:hypothetical protein